MKLKTEASGWPSDVTTSEEKEKFIQNFQESEGISLDPANISKNPGLRGLAKLCLNSMWGRLGMKENKAKTEYVYTPERFNELLLSGTFDVSAFDLF